MTKGPSASAPRCFALEIPHFATFAGVPDIAADLGIDRASLEDPEATVPITVYYDALERAAAQSGDPHFGLRFAVYWIKAAKGGIGTLHFLMRSSATLRIACERLLHYQRYWNRAEWYELVAEDSRAYGIRFRCWGPTREAHVHQAEKTAALIALVPRGVDRTAAPLSVALPHGPRGDQENVAQVLGVKPTYGAPWTEVMLPSEIMDMPLPNASPGLFSFIDRYLEKQLASVPPDEQPYSSRVLAAVQHLLHERGFGQDLVSRSLGVSARTLARRLAEEGTRLREIVDEVRRARSQALLEGKVPIGEVTFLLGYSEPAAFQHAFRRWHGVSPKAWLEAQGIAGRAALPLAALAASAGPLRSAG